ncbi:MAG: TIGR00730 family Rossman fold protein [Sphingomonadales bacterium]
MRICVFSGSGLGRRKAYAVAAATLGNLLGRNGIGLVYGGASVGLMREVADAALAAGGKVIGVMPRSLAQHEVAYTALEDLRIVNSLHERKALMAELSDGFIALPGGIGTLEEIIEAWTWSKLGEHDKPCALLNTAGFFDPLTVFLDSLVGERFLRAEHRAILKVSENPEAILDHFRSFRPTTADKWIREGAD